MERFYSVTPDGYRARRRRGQRQTRRGMFGVGIHPVPAARISMRRARIAAGSDRKAVVHYEDGGGRSLRPPATDRAAGCVKSLKINGRDSKNY